MLIFDERVLTPGAVRREAIEAVRSAAARSSLQTEHLSNSRRRGVLNAIVHVFRDLKESLIAISTSLANGVEYTVEGSVELRSEIVNTLQAGQDKVPSTRVL